MSLPVGCAWQLIQALAVTAVLLGGALRAESAVPLARPSSEPEKAVSCTVAGVSQDRVARDQDVPAADGPRVAAGESTGNGGQVPRPDAGQPQVCPLYLDQKPAPTRGKR